MTEYTNDERDHMAGLVLHFTELATLYGQAEATWSALAKRFDELGDSRNAAKARAL